MTLVLLFGLQGEQIVRQPLVIALLAVPIIDPGLFQRRPGLLAQPPARRRMVRRRPLGADRRQQLLRAGGGDGDRLFGFQSGAALATVVGVLVEVPVMLSVVRIVRASRGWYEAG